MSPLLLLLRFVHVLCGILWVGFAVFTAFFLLPALEEAGADGGKVMAGLQRRGIMTVMPLVALGAILSGIWLYARDSTGSFAGFGRSQMGMALGIGGLMALIAFGHGLFVMRPAMMRAAMLSGGIGNVRTEDERQSRIAEAALLRARGARAARLAAWLLLVAATAMAIARYA